MKRTLLLTLTLLVVLIAAALLWLDFRLMSSRTAVDTQAGTASSGEPALTGEPLLVWVVGPEGMAEEVRAGLLERLPDTPYFHEITLIDRPAPETDTPALVVEILVDESLWTPLYARTALSVDVAFASDGLVDWADLGEVINVFEDTALRTNAGLSLADQSYGLISRPGYQSYLGEKIAGEVTDLVAAELGRQ